MARTKDSGLTYLRRSTDYQEMSLLNQLQWANTAAKYHGVRLDVAQSDLDHAMHLQLSSYKALRLDNGISGDDFTRPGFVAFNQDALADRRISHGFIYKRDRFARPKDAMEAAQLEKKLRTAGITVVFSDTVAQPISDSQPTIMHDLEMLLAEFGAKVTSPVTTRPSPHGLSTKSQLRGSRAQRPSRVPGEIAGVTEIAGRRSNSAKVAQQVAAKVANCDLSPESPLSKNT
jgi:hypothetical protein